MIYTKLIIKSSSKKPYDFIGSKIRGTLGYALKEEVCINPTYKCEGCFGANDCIFYKFYEQKNSTHQYRLDFDLADDAFGFSLLLFGDTQKNVGTVKKALFKSLQEFEDVACLEESVTFEITPYKSVLKLKFITPLRIKKENKFAREDIDLFDILASINKRYYELTNKEYQKLNISKEYKIISKNLYYKELTRKSNVQKTKMHLGGIMGEMIISNIDEQTYKILKLGETLACGKQTVFGLGKIKIEEIA